MQLADNNNSIANAMNSPVTNIAIGMAVYPTDFTSPRTWGMAVAWSYATGNLLWTNYDSIGSGFSVVAGNNQTFQIYHFVATPGVGQTNTLLYTSPNGEIPTDAYTYLEMKIDAGSGILQVWKNGNVKVVELSGVIVGGQFNAYGWGKNNGGGPAYLDDVYVTDGNLLGAQRCYYLAPNADQAPQDWTPATGTDGFAMIDNTPPNPAEYITASVVGNISKFACADLPMVSANVNGMRLCSVQELASSGSGDTVSTALIGTGTYTGASVSANTLPIFYNDIFDFGGSVSVADINAMSIEIEKTV